MICGSWGFVAQGAFVFVWSFVYFVFVCCSVTLPIAAHNSDLGLRRRGSSVYEGIENLTSTFFGA